MAKFKIFVGGITLSFMLIVSSCGNNYASPATATENYVSNSDKLLKNISDVSYSDDEKQCRVEFCHTEDFYETVTYVYDSDWLIFESVYKGDKDYDINDLFAGLGVIYATKELNSCDDESYPYYTVTVPVGELDGPEFTIEAFKKWGKSCETNVTRCPWRPKIDKKD